MADHTEQLKSMLQDIINGREEQATVTMHDYFVSKTRDVTGLAQPETDFNDDENDESYGNEDE